MTLGLYVLEADTCIRNAKTKNALSPKICLHVKQKLNIG